MSSNDTHAPGRASARPPSCRTGVHIGTSGWHYRHWLGPFYPRGLSADRFLAFYAQRFRSVEINATFYRLPTSATLAEWRRQTPHDFVFACKASRYITHMKKLKEPMSTARPFLATLAPLGCKLGPILFQLPPHWRLDAVRLARFLEQLPEGFRYVFEFRDESWFAPQVYRLLARHNAALCLHDFNQRRPRPKLTADFVYVRLHGPDGAYGGTYDGRTLAGWARRIAAWTGASLEVYCYFDNDAAGYAANDARRLAGMLAGRRPDAGG